MHPPPHQLPWILIVVLVEVGTSRDVLLDHCWLGLRFYLPQNTSRFRIRRSTEMYFLGFVVRRLLPLLSSSKVPYNESEMGSTWPIEKVVFVSDVNQLYRTCPVGVLHTWTRLYNGNGRWSSTRSVLVSTSSFIWIQPATWTPVTTGILNLALDGI